MDMTLAAYILAATALGGVALFALYPWVKPAGRVWWPGALHGLAGLVGIGLLAATLVGAPPRGQSTGSGSFGLVAAVLTGLAAALGLVVFAARWRRRQPGMVTLGVHATLAVAGLTMLVAYLSAPA